MALFGDLEPRGKYLYHYTSLAVALDYILPSGTLRLSPFAHVNDPREAKDWHLGFSVDDPAAPSNIEATNSARLRALMVRTTVVLREHTKLVCLTNDTDSRRWDVAGLFRGWGHPRLWAMYGDLHRGVCLIFEKASLDRSFLDLAAGAAGAINGDVAYRDDALPTPLIRQSDVDRLGVEGAVDAYIQESWRDLFFTKNTDWAGEHEHRYVIRSDSSQPMFLPVRDALAGVVAGVDIARRRRAAALIAAVDGAALPFGRVAWTRGVPYIEPLSRDGLRNLRGDPWRYWPSETGSTGP